MSDISHERGLFFATVPYTERDRAEPLRAAGWHFHWGRASGKCHPKCLGCAKGLSGLVWYTPDVPKAIPFLDMADDRAREVIERAQQAMILSRATDAEIDVQSPRGLEYFGFQRAGIAWLHSRRTALLGDEQGVGKTVQAIGAINATPSIVNVLVLAPATLLVNWRRELERWCVRPVSVVLPQTADKVPQRLEPGCGRVQAVVVNPERLINGRGKSRTDDSTLFDTLMNRRWDALVVDEAHRLRNPKAASTQAVYGLRRKGERVSGLIHRADRRWMLTGTPMPSQPVDLWPMLSGLCPATFKSFFVFAKRYCGATKHGGALDYRRWWDFSGYSHLDELQEVLRSGTEHGGFMIRRLKQDVLLELPPKIRHLHVLETSAEAQKAIDAQWSKHRPAQEHLQALRASVLVAELRQDTVGYEAAVARLEKAETVAFHRFSTEREALARLKAPMVVEHLRCLLDGGVRKVVAWGMHYVMIDALAKELADFGVVQLDGRTPASKRMKAVDRFQQDPDCRVFVGHPQAAGVGLTLTASSTVVFAEASYVPGDNAQGEDRSHRVGTAECVHVQYLVLDGSLDQHVMEVVLRKMRAQYDALDRLPDGQQPARPAFAPAQTPVYAPELREAAHRAVKHLAARGAPDSAGQGLRQEWRSAGGWLAEQQALDDRATEIAIQIARWHAHQLPQEYLDSLGIEAPRRTRAPKPRIVKRKGYDFDNKPA